VGAAFLGIYLVVSPGGLFAVSRDALLALCGGAAAGVAIVAVKRLRDTDSPYIIYLSQCVCGLAVVGLPALKAPFFFPPSGWLILIGIGLLSTLAQLIMTYAFKLVAATEGSLIGFLVPVFNVALGVLLFGESIRPQTLIGSLLVLLCCVYVAVRERIFRRVL